MIITYINKAGDTAIEERIFGSKMVGKRCLDIFISPKEIVNAWDNVDNMYSYLKKLTECYKKND